MGVNGLWTVVQPCARPTNLATLNRKRLAVDASIWIYQFLKAVRDKEGNALRNSHVVGFFRRICKLLWFGIRPVFVFDGGAPALKRQTIMGRKRRREGRREDAVRTAGKLLAVQMQRIAEEEGEKRRRREEMEQTGAHTAVVEEPMEELPSVENLVYVDELGMDQKERQKSRKFFKQDAYHLPHMSTTISGMGQPDDPRTMSVEELEEYSRQFNSGEDINLYDFSKIDFEGDFFKSLPPVDRYNILNAARVRSRLRMGLSKEQLDDMFPDRMAFSRFQIERAKERNHLTQRLMQEAGMTGTDLTLAKNARIAGEKDREYILVKNDGVEGGWALGVVSKEKDMGEIHKPIDVDALQFHYQAKEEEGEGEDDDDFVDVPIEGLNRLPKTTTSAARSHTFQDTTNDAAQVGLTVPDDEDDSLFVQDPANDLFESRKEPTLEDDEQEDLSRAIAMSLKNQHGVGEKADEDEVEEEFKDVPAPDWEQKAVEAARPVTAARGKMIAHIVNNRASAAVPKRRHSNASSGDEVDLRTALSAARKKRKFAAEEPSISNPANKKNTSSGPLPFEKLDWKSSIFARKPKNHQAQGQSKDDAAVNGGGFEPTTSTTAEPLAGGFERTDENEEELIEETEAPRPLPPWMQQDETDIREAVKEQEEQLKEVNEEDREAALEAETKRRKEALIELDSSDDDGDVEIVEPPRNPAKGVSVVMSGRAGTPDSQGKATEAARPSSLPVSPGKTISNEENAILDNDQAEESASPPTPEPEMEDVQDPVPETTKFSQVEPGNFDEPIFEDVSAPAPEELHNVTTNEDGELIINEEGDEPGDEFSDPEDEELLAQMAEEAEEHARFASQLNHKSERENQESYERELKALRTQQKKDRRDADEVSQIMITECQALLQLFGLPYITAPMEAEAQCAELVHLGLVDGIVTDDSDIFLFGGTRVYKNMFNSNKFVECYLGADLEKELSLSRESLISLAQLLGSDYTEGLPGVGPVTAVEILSEFPGKDGLLAFREWWQDVQIHNRPKEADATSAFRKKFRKSQGTKLFLPTGFPSPAVFDAYIHPEVDASSDPFQWGVPDVDGLRRYLMTTIGWSQERTDEVLVPVIRDLNRREAEGTQSNITRYFEGSVGVGAKEAFAPRQRAQPSKRMAHAVSRLRAHASTDGSAEGVPEDESLAPTAGQRKRVARRPRVAVSDDDDGHVEDED